MNNDNKTRSRTWCSTTERARARRAGRTGPATTGSTARDTSRPAGPKSNRLRASARGRKPFLRSSGRRCAPRAGVRIAARPAVTNPDGSSAEMDLLAEITAAVAKSGLPWPDYGRVIARALTGIVGNPVTVSVYDAGTVLEFDGEGKRRGCPNTSPPH